MSGNEETFPGDYEQFQDADGVEQAVESGDGKGNFTETEDREGHTVGSTQGQGRGTYTGEEPGEPGSYTDSEE